MSVDPMSIPTSGEITGWVAAVVAAAGAGLALWKRQSSTQLGVREDRSKGDWLGRIEQERDEALKGRREAEDRARESERAVARLEARVSLLTERAERQDRKIAVLMELLLKEKPAYAPLLSSRFGEPDLPGSEEEPEISP